MSKVTRRTEDGPPTDPPGNHPTPHQSRPLGDGPLRIGFRVAADTRPGPTGFGLAYSESRYWTDQPTPPPGQEDRYRPDPDRPWVRWPPLLAPDAPTPQQLRVEQAGHLFSSVVLDPDRCRFTYTRFALVGEVEISQDRHWFRPVEAHDAIDTVLTIARWTAITLYRADGNIEFPDPALLPNLTLSVRAIR